MPMVITCACTGTGTSTSQAQAQAQAHAKYSTCACTGTGTTTANWRVQSDVAMGGCYGWLLWVVADWRVQSDVVPAYRLQVQPCGCNYQWTAARRTIKCPNAPVYMGHGWHAGTTQVTRDPYNKLYHYFKDCEGGGCSAPPFANKTQLSHKDKTSPKGSIEVIHNFDCPQQNMVRAAPGPVHALYSPFFAWYCPLHPLASISEATVPSRTHTHADHHQHRRRAIFPHHPGPRCSIRCCLLWRVFRVY